MKAKSIKGKSPEEIKSALAQCMKDIPQPDGQGFKPTLAIVFISIVQDRKAVCEILLKNGIDILGATSCGEFIDGHQSEGGIAILLLDLPRESYSILFEPIGDRKVSEAATHLAKEAIQRFDKPAMIVCSTGMTKGEFFDGESLVRSIENVIGPQRTFFGGMAGDDFTLTGSYVFTHEKETDYGIAALVLDEDKVGLHGMAITGWKPMGISRTVTKSQGNLVYTIDDQPAPEMYLRYLGKEAMANDENFQVREELGMQYPFLVARDSGEMVLRTPMSIDHNENALVCDIEIKEGTKLWFSMPPDFDIVETIVDEASLLKNTDQLNADALLIFSCAGRLSVLGPLVNSENEGLSEVWKTPMAGFFTYGEYGRCINGRQEFHSGACCWVAIKEK